MFDIDRKKEKLWKLKRERKGNRQDRKRNSQNVEKKG
jgi:hypothetical protein